MLLVHTFCNKSTCLLLVAVVVVIVHVDVVVVVMALFIDSTQATYWTIPDDKLIERRAATHARITRILQRRHLTSSRGNNNNDDNDIPSIDDEATLRRFHEGRILRYVRRARLPDKVGLTAICYFKRFYVDRSVMEFNPSVIALSSLYAAAKVEEVYLPVTTLLCDFDMVVNGLTHAVAVKQPVVNKTKKDEGEGESEDIRVCKGAAVRVCEDALLQTELNFLQRLDFQLICYHALRSVGYVRQVLLGLQQAGNLWSVDDDNDDDNDEKGTSVKDDDGGGKIVKQVCRHANDLVIAVVPLTELILTQTPAIIALATIAIAAVDIGAEKHDDDNNNSDAIAARRVVDAAAKGMRSVHDEVSRAVFTIRVELQRMDAQREQARIARTVDDDEGGGESNSREMEREMEIEIAAEIESRRVRWALQRHDPMSPSFRAEDDVDDDEDNDGKVMMGEMTAERRRDAAFDDTPYGRGGDDAEERSGGRRLMSISRTVSGVKRARGMEHDDDDDDDDRGGGGDSSSSSENEEEDERNNNGLQQQQVIDVDAMDEAHSAKRARLR